MKIRHRALFSLFIIVLIGTTLRVNAQNNSTENILDSNAFALSVKAYHNFLKPENGLYNGFIYYYYRYPSPLFADTSSDWKLYGSLYVSASPFWWQNKFQFGSVIYNGMRYDNVPLLYDLISDVLVTDNPNMTYQDTTSVLWLATANLINSHANKEDPFIGNNIQLQSQLVSAFDIDNHHFERLQAQGANDIQVGFYELLYSGCVKLYKKQRKSIEDRHPELSPSDTSQAYRWLIHSVSSYYIRKDNQYYVISKRKAIPFIFTDKRKLITIWLRKNKSDFADDKESTLIKLVRYYDSLTSN
jgi:hypothetical protein